MSSREIIAAIARQEAEKLAWLNGFVFITTTENATPVNIATIEIPDYTSGHLEIDVVAVLQDGSAKFTAKWIVGIFKDTSLIIDTENVLHSENGIAGASFSVVDDSDNPAIQLTGVAATNISWQVRVNQFLLTIIPVAP